MKLKTRGRKPKDRDTLNLKKGSSKWQSVLDDNQHIKLMWHFAENDWDNSAGRELIEGWFHSGELPDWFKWEDRKKPVVSPKALYNWKVAAHEKHTELIEAESNMPVDWSNREKIALLSNVPIEGSMRGELFQWWQHLERTIEENRLDTPPEVKQIRPSYRALKWWAYMYDYYPELEINDKIWIAEQFFWRDALTAADQPDTLEMDRDDLDKWLLHKPWESVEKYEIYLNKIEAGIIPPLDVDHWAFDNKQAIEWLHGESKVPDMKKELAEMKEQAAKDSDHPFKGFVPQYLLPSQRMSWDEVRKFVDAWTRHLKSQGISLQLSEGVSPREVMMEQAPLDPSVPDIKPIIYEGE